MPEAQLDHPLIIDLGIMKYDVALEHQRLWHDKVAAGQGSVILTVEHEPVLTLGKNADSSNLLFPIDHYRELGVEFSKTERGGDVTAHMPGQLVVYPIIDIQKQKLSVRSYVECLEASVIDTLSFFGIKSARDLSLPGVWVGSEKICAIGVRVKSRVTMHGIALNINNNLDLFGKIIPCGIKSRGVTSMQKLLGQAVLLDEVRTRLVQNIMKNLQTFG